MQIFVLQPFSFFSEGVFFFRCNSSSAAEEGAVRDGALDACWRLVAVSVSNMEIPFVRCTGSVPRRHMVLKRYTDFTDLLKSLSLI